RTLHPHVLRNRHARPRHARDERRHLSWHDRPEEHDALPPDQGRPALGRALREVRGQAPADARGVRDRLGSDHAVPGRLADPHRRDPIFRGCLEGTLPGSYSENSVMSSVQRAAIAWNILTGAGIPGIRDVYVHPITNGVNVCVKITKHYQGQPKQIAAALWGNSAAQYRYKHVWIVEDDIDIASYEQIDWAVAHRVN